MMHIASQGPSGTLNPQWHNCLKEYGDDEELTIALGAPDQLDLIVWDAVIKQLTSFFALQV